MITYYLFKVIDWLNPLVYIAGFAIAVWAFRRCRKPGYLVVSFYFALVVFTLVAMPSINRRLAERRGPDISEQTQEKINQAMSEAMHRVLEEEGHPPVTAKRGINLPLGPVLLVTGLWLLARREKKSPNHQLEGVGTNAPDPQL